MAVSELDRRDVLVTLKESSVQEYGTIWVNPSYRLQDVAIDAILLRTNGHKAGGMSDVLSHRYGYGGLVGVIGSTNFEEPNQYTQCPDIVAVAKAVQENEDGWLRMACLGLNQPPAAAHTILKESKIASVTTDIMVEVADLDSGRREVLNKPQPDWNKQQLYAHLVDLVVAPDMDAEVITHEMKLKVGMAAFEHRTKRGVFGTISSLVQLRAVSIDDIALYVFGLQAARSRPEDIIGAYQKLLERRCFEQRAPLTKEQVLILQEGMPLSAMLGINGGIAWEHPVWDGAIAFLDNVPAYQHKLYNAYKERFMCRAWGRPDELAGIIIQLDDFAKSRCQGDSTNYVQQFLRDYAHLIGDVGRWQQAHFEN